MSSPFKENFAKESHEQKNIWYRKIICHISKTTLICDQISFWRLRDAKTKLHPQSVIKTVRLKKLVEIAQKENLKALAKGFIKLNDRIEPEMPCCSPLYPNKSLLKSPLSPTKKAET